MNQTYKTRIQEYCAANGILIPPGFARNAPSRYVLVRTDKTPPKIVANTWFKQDDVLYYFDHFLVPEIGEELAKTLLILDFKTGRRMQFNGTSKLFSGELFMEQQDDEPAAGPSSPDA